MSALHVWSTLHAIPYIQECDQVKLLQAIDRMLMSGCNSAGLWKANALPSWHHPAACSQARHSHLETLAHWRSCRFDLSLMFPGTALSWSAALPWCNPETTCQSLSSTPWHLQINITLSELYQGFDKSAKNLIRVTLLCDKPQQLIVHPCDSSIRDFCRQRSSSHASLKSFMMHQHDRASSECNNKHKERKSNLKRLTQQELDGSVV